MHRRGFDLMGGLRVPEPQERPDFRSAHAPSVRDLVKEPPPKGPPTRMEKLIAEPVSNERNLYLGRLALLEEEIDAFLERSKSQSIAALEHRRAEQLAQCRAAEDAFKNVKIELATARGQIANHSAELNRVRTEQAESEIPPFDSNFPTPAETAQWNEKRRAAQAIRNREEQIHQQLQQAELQIIYRHESAAKALNEAAEKLRALDRELKSLV
jgi:hypothetical protein